jgi:N-acyl-D-aspartate/D-glutamate deacylase
LKDRGVIRRGARADLVVFDPAAVRDTATYASPQQVAEGTRWVVVNGVVVVDEGKPTGATPGRVLSPERR